MGSSCLIFERWKVLNSSDTSEPVPPSPVFPLCNHRLVCRQALGLTVPPNNILPALCVLQIILYGSGYSLYA